MDTNLKSKGINLKLIYIVMIIFLLLLLQIFMYFNGPLWSNISVNYIGILSLLFALIYIIFDRRINIISFIGAYFFYLSITHMGFPISELLSANPFESYKYWDIDWYYSQGGQKSILLSGIGICSFVIGIAIFNQIKKVQPKNIDIRVSKNKYIYMLGIFLLIFSLIYFLYVSLSGRLVFFSEYGAFRDSMSKLSFYPWILLFFSTGLAFISATGNRKQVITGWLIFSLFAIPLLFSGNRGEVFFPIGSALAVLGYRGLKVNVKIVGSLFLILFLLIPFIKETRSSGLTNMESIEIDIGITDPITEMGFTLRPLTHTVQWIDQGEPLGYGVSYFLPLHRLLGKIPGIEERPLAGNRAYFDERLPGFGYSVIAEAFFNFGLLGVIVVMFLIGVVIGFFNIMVKGSFQLALFGGIVAIMLNNIRNTFLFVPGHLIVVTTLILLTYFMSQFALKKRVIDR
ncbi:hypothetical protein GCM10009865_50350 [Aeromicrobium ponti]|uniref:Oligosaccharide repeat unit polymerase n=1 Tax=Cytobacillus oceanisediminis TaxID=665099 RepID=A0A562J7R5_9BACI|nr:O-antigen polysaccharide polymerase Wzy [Cytobacillus oceanisediminis]TWH79226.1 oligosaccharide repeat unit polymerase [Cytobacillus oceanisediminis]